MRLALIILTKLLCLAALLIFCVFAVEPRSLRFSVPILHIISLGWLGAYLKIIYFATAVWALLESRKAATTSQRFLFLSVVAVAGLVVAADILTWSEPRLATVLHHPIGTALGYLFGMLTIICLLLAARSKKQLDEIP